MSGQYTTDTDDVEALLEHGSIEVIGRLAHSSNATLLVRLEVDGGHGHAVYKPLRGERPLWDFPPGLYKREIAARMLSDTLGLDLVPPTIHREGPFGEGSLQLFIDADPREHYFSIYESRPDLHDRLRDFAFFDFIANNTDRKSGHILLMQRIDSGESTMACASAPTSSCVPSSGTSVARTFRLTCSMSPRTSSTAYHFPRLTSRRRRGERASGARQLPAREPDIPR